MRAELILLFSLSFFIQSCNYDFPFNELEVINLYNVGDTIVFQNQDKELDSILIVTKKFGHANDIYDIVDRKKSDPTCYIEYKNIPKGKKELFSFGPKGATYTETHEFLNITKYNPEYLLNIDIGINGFKQVFEYDISKIRETAEYGKHLIFTSHCKNRKCMGVDSASVVEVIWRINKGIVAFETKDKTKWKLIK